MANSSDLNWEVNESKQIMEYRQTPQAAATIKARTTRRSARAVVAANLSLVVAFASSGGGGPGFCARPCKI